MSEIIIESNNSEKRIERKIEINQTTCAAEWGGITGDIADQADLIAKFGEKLDKSVTVSPVGTDLNSLSVSGVYSVYAPVNAPVVGNYQWYVNVISDGMAITQTAYNPSTKEIYFRMTDMMMWGGVVWVKVVDESALNTKLDKNAIELSSDIDNLDDLTAPSVYYKGGAIIEVVKGRTGHIIQLYHQGGQVQYRSTYSGSFSGVEFKGLLWSGEGILLDTNPIIFDNAQDFYAQYMQELSDPFNPQRWLQINSAKTIFSGIVEDASGKSLSTNDYTDTEKTKLANIEAGAQVNAVNTVIDANYVHTDNNYTSTEKTKLSSAVTSSTIATIVTLTQTAYDAIPIKDPNIMYIITGA